MITDQSSWQAWQPSSSEPWDVRRVVHLHRRAGFGATPGEVEQDLADGPSPAVDRFLTGTARSTTAPSDFDQMSDVIGNAAVSSNDPNRLKAWWMYRIMFAPDPLTEKLTLMWHNHFATSNLKVDDLEAMKTQNETLRELCQAPFDKLLQAMLHDPALLQWLDAPSNKQGAANENLARELMELFTLGIGNYTETDVKEAARALTGWTVRRGSFFYREADHDAGEKVILGSTGSWKTEDLARMLLEHPATSRRLAWRICDLFLGEGVVDDQAIEQLANGLREHHLDTRWAIETVLRSKVFYSDANIAARVSSPVEFTVGAVRALEAFDPPPSTLLMAEWAGRLGQDLFYPPNVGGWTGGRDWLGARYVVGRANFAAAIVKGHLNRASIPPTLQHEASSEADQNNLRQNLNAYRNLLVGKISDGAFDRLLSVAEEGGQTSRDKLEIAVALLLASPEAQTT